MTGSRWLSPVGFGLAALGSALAPAPVAADEQAPLTLCLAAAADDSPVYPLREVPANHREISVVFRLREGEAFEKLEQVWTTVDVGDAAPPDTVIAKGDLALGSQKHGHLHFTLPKDIPAGTYRLAVSMDGKPWSSLDLKVVPAAEVKPLGKPSDLLPLDPGTTWTYSLVLEPGPAVKKLTFPGAERGPDGKFRAVATYKVVGTDEAGRHVEIRRNDVLANEEWWALGPTGLAVARERNGGQETPYDPPVPTIRLPLASPASWTYRPKDESFERTYKMWGPLPVAGPKGETSGWIVLSKTTAGVQSLTIEREFVLGVGIVREVQVSVAGDALLTRLETSLVPPK